MTYLDTGCFVKLYYPEPDSARVVSHVQGKQICYTPLHELEFMNALQLKVFFNSATASQVTAARALVDADLKAGVVAFANGDWKTIFQEAVKLADQFTGSIGCRSLDVLHCAAAKALAATEFISTGTRQKKLATTMGLNAISTDSNLAMTCTKFLL